METVEVEQSEWLFYPFIPFGKVTIIQGDPGEGRTADAMGKKDEWNKDCSKLIKLIWGYFGNLYV